MAKLYYRLVKEGRWLIDEVPAIWRAEVERLLAADE